MHHLIYLFRAQDLVVPTRVLVMNFAPTVDRIRIVSDMGQNLRANPITGAVAAVDTDLNPGTPAVSAAAYDSNFAGTPTITLYDIDLATDKLYRQTHRTTANFKK